MKIQVISDTHARDFTLSEEADLIVHAGDFGNHGLHHLYKFVDKCTEANKAYVLVLGNHDMYGENFYQIYKKLDEKNINYLSANKTFVFQGKTFVGGTLFSNFRSNIDEEWEVDSHISIAKDLYDFKVIETGFDFNGEVLSYKHVTPEEYITEFNKQYNWINKFRDRDDVVVVTHFPMSIECLDPYWGSHEKAKYLNPYFINNLNVKGFKTIISGHTHTAVDKVVDGCRLIINPLGHVAEEGNGFIPELIIEV